MCGVGSVFNNDDKNTSRSYLLVHMGALNFLLQSGIVTFLWLNQVFPEP